MAGSLGYAERLTARDDVGGRLGDPELLDEGARRTLSLEPLMPMHATQLACV